MTDTPKDPPPTPDPISYEIWTRIDQAPDWPPVVIEFPGPEGTVGVRPVGHVRMQHGRLVVSAFESAGLRTVP